MKFYLEPQVMTTVIFNKRKDDEMYSRKWSMYRLVLDPNRRVMKHIYVGWEPKDNQEVEIRY